MVAMSRVRVLIVAKTRRGSGACVGGITRDGRSVRLIAADPEAREHAGLEYEVGDVWELEATADPDIVPPHVENILVHRARRLKRLDDPVAFILRHMPPVEGGPEKLFDGLVQAAPSGALYIAKATGVPTRSTMFWRPDRPLRLEHLGKRLHFTYRHPTGRRMLAYVGFPEPPDELPAGALVRVSLAHWWRPRDKPDEELRCYLQLSGWFVEPETESAIRKANEAVRPAAPSTESSPVAAGSPGSTGRSAVSVATKPAASAVQVTGATRTPSPVADMNRARELLQRVFGFHAFLPLQETVVRRVLEGGDTLLVMPTGGGKSLCYQLPAMVFDGLTLVVSPLIALMQDQVMQLKQLGVPAAFLNSTLTHAEYVRVTRRVRQGEIKLLYAAPETLVRPETLRLLGDSRLCCIAVDEAHCISEWGHDFRPEYRQLREVRSRFADAVCLALTATATPRVRQDIREQLSIPAQGEFVASFDRPNLYLAVRRRQRGLPQLLAFLEQHRGQSGIIYCSTRRQVDRLSEQLGAAGWPNLPYHAGLEDDVRREHQEQFIRDRVPIMVATIAFGMGINKSDVRFIVHYNLPKNLEHYYQEIGRAGRDGLPAHCLLLYSRSDAITIERFIEEGAESERPGREARLRAMLDYAETTGCRRVPLLGYFGETHPGACGQCDHCVTAAPETAAASAPEPPTPLEDVTVQVQKLLSCVHRTGQRFGATHVVDVLRGSRSKKVLRWGHDQLTTHG
ncbi:MAG: RecQ family ATP-dependent DNA helicase, partial [Verrucomicrobia bacterium]